MKFDKETLNLLELYIETLFHRLSVIKAIGKNHPIVDELDKQIDAVRAKLTGEI